MRAVACLVVLLGGLALSPAPIHDPEPGRPVPERSQGARAAEQAHQGHLGVVGLVPDRTDENGRAVEDTVGKIDAESTLASAGAAKTLREEASPRVSATSSPARPVAWGVGALVAGLLAAFGLKVWLDRTVPPPPPSRALRW